MRIIELLDTKPWRGAIDVNLPVYNKRLLSYVRLHEKVILKANKFVRPGYVRIGGAEIQTSTAEVLFRELQDLAALAETEDTSDWVLVPRGNIWLTALVAPSAVEFDVLNHENVYSVYTYRSSAMFADGALVPPALRGIKVMPMLPPGYPVKHHHATACDARKLMEPDGERWWVKPAYDFLDGNTTPCEPGNPKPWLDRLGQLEVRLACGPVDMACDIETRAGQISCIGIAYDELSALCVPLMSEANYAKAESERSPHYFSHSDEFAVLSAFKRVLENPNARVIGQNFAYDLSHLYPQLAIIPRFEGDLTHIVASVDPQRPKDLAYTASYLAPYYRYWKAGARSFFDGGFESELWHYNCLDCWYTLRSYQLGRESLSGAALSTFMYLRNMFYPFVAMSLSGLPLDISRWNTLRHRVQKLIDAQLGDLAKIMGRSLSVDSATDVSELLGAFDERKRASQAETLGVFIADQQNSAKDMAERFIRESFESWNESGVLYTARKESYDENNLKQLGNGNPIAGQLVARVLSVRQLQKVKSNILDARPYVRASSKLSGGRREVVLTGSINLLGTITYRMTAGKDLLNNGTNVLTLPRDPIPSVGHIRSAVKARPGYFFEEFDLSRGDIQVLARTRKNSVLLQNMNNNLDLYLATGLLCERGHLPLYEDLCEGSPNYKELRASLTDAKRYFYKTACHAIDYGARDPMVGRVFSQGPLWGAKVREAFFHVAPEVGLYQDLVIARLRDGLPVQNHYGMEIMLDERQVTNGLAWGPQSTVARYINSVWVWMTQHYPDWRVCLQFHDALIVEVPEAYREFDFHAVIERIGKEVLVPESNFYPAFSLPLHCTAPMDRWAPLGE